MTHAEYANGLRALADFIEENPWIPVPLNQEVTTMPRSMPPAEQKAHAARVARALGKVGKRDYEDNLILRHSFNSSIGYAVWYSRDALCERVIVGTKLVPASEEYVIPARPAHEEEIVEWKCSPILAGTEEL